MSVLFRGGYHVFTRQIVNITLQPTAVWHNGNIVTNKNMLLSTLQPHKENKLEMINYDDTAVLLLNNNIIYENKKLFTYKINLSLTDDDFTFNKSRFDSCIRYQLIKLP